MRAVPGAMRSPPSNLMTRIVAWSYLRNLRICRLYTRLVHPSRARHRGRRTAVLGRQSGDLCDYGERRGTKPAEPAECGRPITRKAPVFRRRMYQMSSTTLFSLAIGSLALHTATAQLRSPNSHPLTIESYGGTTLFSRFLEQRLDEGDRELTAETAPNAGLALSCRAWDKAGIRISGSFVPASLRISDEWRQRIDYARRR